MDKYMDITYFRSRALVHVISEQLHNFGFDMFLKGFNEKINARKTHNFRSGITFICFERQRETQGGEEREERT